MLNFRYSDVNINFTYDRKPYEIWYYIFSRISNVAAVGVSNY